MSYHKILWSKGPFITPYASLDTEKGVTDYVKVLILQSNGFLWIRNTSQGKSTLTDLDYVSKYISLIKKPTVLITTDGDRAVPSSYRVQTVTAILRCPKITAWYTQNYDRTIIHPKLKYMPIGFDFHSPSMLVGGTRDSKLRYMCYCREISKEKVQDKVLSDAHYRLSHPSRQEMYDTIKDNKHINFLNDDRTFLEITQLYNKYQFVLSPRGAGLDCHRTWELFLAGCIVITLTSSLDEMYTKNNLPVVILKTWNELNVDLPSKLERWYKEYSGMTSSDNILHKLTFKYWTKP